MCFIRIQFNCNRRRRAFRSTAFRRQRLGCQALPSKGGTAERRRPIVVISFNAPMSVVLSYGVDSSAPFLTPKQYCMPSNVLMYTRPLAVESPPQWLHDVI